MISDAVTKLAIVPASASVLELAADEETCPASVLPAKDHFHGVPYLTVVLSSVTSCSTLVEHRAMIPGKLVIYLRVSTDRQGKSGLGIEAQRAAVADFMSGSASRTVGEFVEVESGKNNERPELAAAIQACRLYGARLLIAKLDRLSRDAHFLLGLEKAGVEFVCADMPSANRLTVGILAMVAEEERRMISARTKAALQAAKARGTVLGGYRGYAFSAADVANARTTRKSAAADRAAAVAPAIADIQASGVTSMRGIAAALTERCVPTSRGREVWSAMQVKRAMVMITQ